MKERPILFSGSMVRALLDGRKTQTRRIVKPQPEAWKCDDGNTHYAGLMPDGTYHDVECDALGKFAATCPFGAPGDRLWVKETHRLLDCECDTCRVPGYVYYDADCGGYIGAFQGKKRPSIHMPRWASRITLEIVGVRVERLQDISEADAMAEGVDPILVPPDGGSCPHVEGYRELWELIHGTGSWSANPWVWCIEFKRVTQ